MGASNLKKQFNDACSLAGYLKAVEKEGHWPPNASPWAGLFSASTWRTQVETKCSSLPRGDPRTPGSFESLVIWSKSQESEPLVLAFGL